LNFVKGFFCIYWSDHVIFVLYSIYVQYYVHWFVYVEPSLYPRMKPAWSCCMIFLMCCWTQLAGVLLRIFVSIFIKNIGL
jgi:hypothetical protein